MDAADPGGGQKDVVGLFPAQEFVDGPLVEQVEFLPGTREQIAVAALLQPAHDGGADHAAMAGDINARRAIHHLSPRTLAPATDRVAPSAWEWTECINVEGWLAVTAAGVLAA